MKLAVKWLLIVYFSGEGHTRKMAEKIFEGADQFGLKVELRSVEECKVGDLAEADGIVVGSPTYFSNVAWQVKKLIDESITLYRKDHVLKDKVGGCFTSAGTRRDGKDCIKRLEVAFGFHHRMKLIPGIIRASGDEETQVSKMCRQYGEEIAKQFARAALRKAIDKIELYELLYGIEETDSLVVFSFEKGYKDKIFSNPRKETNKC